MDWSKHQVLEKSSILLLLSILVVVAIGGLFEIAPLFWLSSTIEKVSGIRPYTPLELAGRDIYIREGCYVCHSQMIRSLPGQGGGPTPRTHPPPRHRRHTHP